MFKDHNKKKKNEKSLYEIKGNILYNFMELFYYREQDNKTNTLNR